jgi:17beta-estradiol 17-dehydrogenase / very-long-chain 3-oxoacyl-CoA reductase
MRIFMTLNTSFLLQVLGAILLIIATLNITRWLWKYAWLPQQKQGSRLAKRYGRGSWVLITGASDGLGKAFAQELAQYGFNLLLVSRTQEKLSRLQTELETFGIQARTVCADLSDSSEQTYSRIAAAAQDVDLSIVINCVGVTVHRLYADIPSTTVRHLLSLNVNTTAIVTHTLLPLLLRHSATTGQRSALLNVGSIVGRFYWPGTQLYGACKAFIDHLTVPLAFEYREQLDALSFQPTVMATAMASGTEPAAITITPQAAAHAGLSHLGHCVSSHGHWRHAMLAALFSVLPSVRRNRIFLANALEMGEAEQAKGN